MKKILFLLLCTVSIYGQTTTGQETEFDYGIRNNSMQTITTPAFITTTGIDGTQGKIPSAYIAKTEAVQDSLDKKLNISDLPTNLTLYPTTAASDVGGYVVMVKDIHDVRYNNPSVDVTTPTITTTDQLVSQRISDAGVLIGQPGVFNVTTFGNIRRLSGTGTASFYFRVYHRDAAGVETLIGQSSNSAVVSSSSYMEFSASMVWNDGDFVATDRIVIKTYANRVPGNSNPVYQFQFGGTQPVRTLLAVPFSVVNSGFVKNTGNENISGVKTFNDAILANEKIEITTSADALYINKTAGGNSGIIVNNDVSASGNPIVVQKNSVNKLVINDNGEITGNKYVKTGGTSSQFLKADGSVDSSTYHTGTLTTNYIPKATGSGTLGNSLIYQTTSNIIISSIKNSIGGTVQLDGSWTGGAVFGADGVDKFMIGNSAFLSGGATLGGANSALNAFAPVGITGSYIKFGINASEVMRLNLSGNLLINTTSDDGVNKLQVNGSTKTTALTLSTAPTTSAGTYDILTRNTSTGVVEKAPQSYIYVAMSGQSNAVGYTLGTGGDFTVNNSVEVWNTSTNAWEVATSSNTHDVLQNGSPSTSNNIGWQFCKLLQKQTGKKVRYVLSALGGTSITEWENTTASQYVKLKTAIVNSAIPKIDYFLWHQGEADVAMSAATFETKLKAFYTAIKAETFFGKNTIILNGQLKKTGGQGFQNVTYSKIEKEASNDIRLVSSTDLVGWDLAHFTGAELDVFAQRYFNAAMGSDRTIYETIADSFVPMNSTLGFDLVGTGRSGLFQNGNLFEFGNSSILNEKYLTIGRNSLSTNPVEMQGFNAGVGYDSLTLQPLGSELLIGTRTNNFTDKVQVNGSILATTFKGGAALTGTPTAPTATVGTNTTQIATTAFVLANATGASLSANNIFTGQNTFSDYTTLGAPITLKSYTVATLPEGNAGDTAYVTDALAPTYMATVVGGGTIVTPVFYNGTNWVAH